MGEEFKLQMCISYWKCRRARGIFAPLFIWHNLMCELRAAHYEIKLRRIQGKRLVRVK